MKKRLAYIDALRGLAVFTVVYSHILLFCADNYQDSLLIQFLRTYFIVGFFFISGFVGYKEMDWNAKTTGQYMWKKFYTLFVPTVVCGSVYMLTHHISLIKGMADSAKMGYWFTFVLFIISIVYALIMWCTKRISNKWIKSALLIVVSLGSLVINRTSLVTGNIQDCLSLDGITGYLPFFLWGILAKRHQDIYDTFIIDNKWGQLIVTYVVVLSYILPIPSFLSQLAVILFLWFIFKKMDDVEILPPPTI